LSARPNNVAACVNIGDLKSSLLASSFQRTPQRTIGSYSLLLGHIIHVNFDRERFRQKIKQVDIQIECPGIVPVREEPNWPSKARPYL
jgi:hypothetical protein